MLLGCTTCTEYPALLCCCTCYQDGNMKKVLELAGHATALQGSNDWWWQERLGKAYYQLGLLRDADKHFAEAADLQVGCARGLGLHHCGTAPGMHVLFLLTTHTNQLHRDAVPMQLHTTEGLQGHAWVLTPGDGIFRLLPVL
jgi:hypothetical protein